VVGSPAGGARVRSSCRWGDVREAKACTRSDPRRRAPRALAALVLFLGCLVGAYSTLGEHSGKASARPGPVYVFPIPGSQFATTQTQISFRGLNVSQLGGVVVTGSSSGLHQGPTLSHSDGKGASFVPKNPFTPGEVVTVRTNVDVPGGLNGAFQFRVAYPAGPNRPSPFSFARRVPGDVLRFRSRPDLAPVAIRVLKRSRREAPGNIFLGPHVGPLQNGPMILDRQGQLVWFHPLPGNHFAADFRVQRYHGQRVLTWWQGIIRLGTGDGEDVIYNNAYQPVTAVDAANGLKADFHEFQLSRRGTALITAYHSVFIDARAVGGSAHQDTLDGVVQEIDIPTGLVLFQWDSLDHVPLAGSHGPLKAPYNYFHLNSIDEDADGNLIISGRNTWSAYKVNRRTARTMWVLGGRHSTFAMGRGTQFAWQHDVRVRGRGDRLVTVYDDGGAPFVHNSRGLTLRLDLKHRRASVARQDDHVPPLRALFEGNLQRLPDGHDFVGWGQAPYFSEFDRSGRMIFDARFADRNVSYRVWRFPWSGYPQTTPDVAAQAKRRRMTAWVSWNGATNVAVWRLLAGPSPALLRRVGRARRRNFETAITARRALYVAVEAVDHAGHVIGRSATIPVH